MRRGVTAFSCSTLEAYMRCDDAPALRKAHPGLHLPAFAPGADAPVLATRRCDIAPESGDDNPNELALDVGSVARGTKPGNRFVPVELLARAVANGARRVPEQLVQRRHVVGIDRALIALERGLHLRHHARRVDLH